MSLFKRQSSNGKPCVCGYLEILTVGQISTCHKCGLLPPTGNFNQISSQCRAENRYCVSCQGIVIGENPVQVDGIVVPNAKGKPKRVKRQDVALPEEIVLIVENDQVLVPVHNGVIVLDPIEPVQEGKKRKRRKNNVAQLDLPEHVEKEKVPPEAVKPVEQDEAPHEVANIVDQDNTSVEADERVEQADESVLGKPGEKDESDQFEVLPINGDNDVEVDMSREERVDIDDNEEVIVVDEGEFIEIYHGSSPLLRDNIPDNNDYIYEIVFTL